MKGLVRNCPVLEPLQPIESYLCFPTAFFQDTYLRSSVETAFPISSLFGANLRALALAAEEAKFPPRSALAAESGQSGRREAIEKMPVKGAKQVVGSQ